MKVSKIIGIFLVVIIMVVGHMKWIDYTEHDHTPEEFDYSSSVEYPIVDGTQTYIKFKLNVTDNNEIENIYFGLVNEDEASLVGEEFTIVNSDLDKVSRFVETNQRMPKENEIELLEVDYSILEKLYNEANVPDNLKPAPQKVEA